MLLCCFYLQKKSNLLKLLEDVDPDGSDPGKGALKLMDRLFTPKEMARSCYKDVHGRCTKPELEQEKRNILESKQDSVCEILIN